jgi:ABC-2 type transport system ATP-binding protein
MLNTMSGVPRLALEMRGVTKRYGSRDVLQEVELAVGPGQLHGLLGPNGAGKTTLMRIALGLVRRDSGVVLRLGRALTATTEAVPDGVAGFVDSPTFYPYLSGRKNLQLLARFDGPAASRAPNAVDVVLEQVGLADHARTPVGAYSAGMRQRLGVAAALLRRPQLLLLDEPTSSLDPAAARDMRSLVRRLADAGVAVVWSSHDMTEVDELCTTLTVIHRGRVVFSGTPHDMQKRAAADLHRLHTSDDRAAFAAANDRDGLRVAISADGDLEVTGDADAFDAYVIALGCSGIAVRRLSRSAQSLETVFLDLTRPTP